MASNICSMGNTPKKLSRPSMTQFIKANKERPFKLQLTALLRFKAYHPSEIIERAEQLTTLAFSSFAEEGESTSNILLINQVCRDLLQTCRQNILNQNITKELGKFLKELKTLNP